MAPDSTVQMDEAQSAASLSKNFNQRPSKPDVEQHKKELTVVEKEIDNLNKELSAVKNDLTKYDPRKGPQAEKRNQLISRLQEIRTEQNELKRSRGKVFDRQASLTTSISKKVGELKAMQAKTTYKTVDEIDEVIKKNEKRIASGKLKIIDEKRLDDENASLRRAKKFVEQCVNMEQKIESERAELTNINNELADTNAQSLSEEHEKLQTELDTLKSSQDEGIKKRSGLLDERTRIQKAIDEAWDRKRNLQDEYRKLNSDFFKWREEERKRRAVEEKQKKIQEQREKRLAIAQEQREEAEIPAFQDEINGCDSLIQYLSGFQSVKQQPAAESGPVSSAKSEDNTRPSSAASSARSNEANSSYVPAGMVAVKKNDQDEMYFAGASKSKKRSARKDRKNGSSANGKSESLKHPLAVAERFLELKVDIPTLVVSIPATIEKLNERKQYFIENQTKVTEENKKKAEERIAKLMAELEVDEKIAANFN